MSRPFNSTLIRTDLHAFLFIALLFLAATSQGRSVDLTDAANTLFLESVRLDSTGNSIAYVKVEYAGATTAFVARREGVEAAASIEGGSIQWLRWLPSEALLLRTTDKRGRMGLTRWDLSTGEYKLIEGSRLQTFQTLSTRQNNYASTVEQFRFADDPTVLSFDVESETFSASRGDLLPANCWEPALDQSFKVSGSPQQLTWSLTSLKKQFTEWKLQASFLDRLQGTALASISESVCRAYFLSSVGRDTLALISVDLRSGQENTLFEGSVDVAYAVIDAATKAVAAVGIDDPYPRVVGLDPRTEGVLKGLSEKYTPSLRLIDIAPGGRFWLLRVDDATCQPRWLVFDTAEAKERWSMAVPGAPAARCNRTIAKVPAGDELIDAIVTTPTDKDCKHEACPAVLVIHGGPALRDTFDADLLAAAIAKSGAISLSVNYRGSLGYGKRFMSLDAESWGTTIPRDVYAALDHLSAMGLLSGPIVAMGSSFGGYLAMLATTRDSRANCAAAHATAPDLKQFVEETVAATGGATDLLARVGDPTHVADVTAMRRDSPSSYVAKGASPMLLVHGAQDTVARPQSQISFAKLRAKHAPTTMAILVGEGHDILSPRARTFYYDLLGRFLTKCFSYSPAPVKLMKPHDVDIVVDGLELIGAN